MSDVLIEYYVFLFRQKETLFCYFSTLVFDHANLDLCLAFGHVVVSTVRISEVEGNDI